MSSKLRIDAWESFVSGDEVSFKKVFKNYYSQMYGYGLKICSQPELVEDCIQELFQNVWERRDNLTHVNSPNVYLFVSLRRKILKKIKKNSKTECSGTLYENDIEFDIHFAIDEIIINQEAKKQQKKVLVNALNQLSNRQKEIIYLYFYNGMSYGEIEEILSMNRQSVRNLMYRAIKSLRSMLDTQVLKLVSSL